MQELRLNKFNPKILEKRRLEGNAPVIAIIGGRGTGKSTITQHLLYTMKKIPVAMAMSGTEEGNGFFSKHIHDVCIYNKFEPEVIEKIIKRQKKYVKELSEKNIDPKKHPELGVGIIMDDLAYDQKMMKNENIKQIFFNGRHFHITTIITFQYMMGLAPAFRTNVDFLFVCRENKKDNIKRLYDYFFGMFDTFEDFKKVFNACTSNYGCLVLDNTSKSNKIEDSVYWFRAEPNLQFKIGTPEMWSVWSSQLRDMNENEEREERTSLSKSKIKEIKKLGPRKVDIEEEDDILIQEDDIDEYVRH